ncbi:hypothetical protein [Halorientalis sp.]|uniref:hypothetical protein n=1 Tax=Halorientalis sp. TaxID=1931229 RepID=UPI00262DD61A|nr:hypothetical protein [Halorientalis sp.]
MTDSDPSSETVPTTYLPDHLLSSGQGGIPRVRTINVGTADEGTDTADGADDEVQEASDNPAAEFCRSWRRHRSRSRSFPF